MPVLLDTDHLSILEVQCWLANLNRARKPKQIIDAYTKLEVIWRAFLRMNVLSYTLQAQAHFVGLKRECPRVRTMDLRIASIALATDSTLLSRNLRDFRQVPGLSVEDWTIA